MKTFTDSLAVTYAGTFWEIFSFVMIICNFVCILYCFCAWFLGPSGRQVHASMIGSPETGFDVDFTPVEVGTCQTSIILSIDNINLWTECPFIGGNITSSGSLSVMGVTKKMTPASCYGDNDDDYDVFFFNISHPFLPVIECFGTTLQH